MNRLSQVPGLKGFIPSLFSIRVRLTLWYVAVFGLVLVAFAAVVYVAVSQVTRAKVESYLNTQSAQLAATYDPSDGLLHPPAQSDLGPGHIGAGEVVFLLTPTGQVKQQFSSLTAAGVAQVGAFARTNSPSSIPSQVYPLTLPLETPGGQVVNQDFLLVLTPIRVQHQHAATLVVGAHSEFVTRQDTLLLILVIAVPATLLVLAGGGYWLATRAMRPVRLITRTARQIGTTNLHQRLQVPGRDELAELAATFNQMLGRLEAAFERQRQFTADASHELRTPLAIITAEATRALARRRSPEEYEQILATIYAEGEQMSRLVQDLLTLARAEAGPGTLNKEPVDLSDLTLEVVERLAPLARAQGLILATGDLPELSTVGDPLFLRQMLTNLVENAIKYTSGAGTRVHVETGCQQEGRQQWAWIRVEDDGPGISAEHLTHLFDRFYRGDLARTNRLEERTDRSKADHLPGGSGLGLSIVQWVAQAHGGEVCVQSEVRRGSVFTIRLPL